MAIEYYIESLLRITMFDDTIILKKTDPDRGNYRLKLLCDIAISEGYDYPRVIYKNDSWNTQDIDKYKSLITDIDITKIKTITKITMLSERTVESSYFCTIC